ncbi:type II toxin-antitoxin system HicB family antitoxin [Blautia obeum]|nr:type II toxin-antitoxin system HicB family antitoxin [Blautia obeum]
MKYSSEEKCYIVTVPDLPGCMADGRTPNEAFENVKNVITEWIDTATAAGRTIPEAKFAQENF